VYGVPETTRQPRHRPRGGRDRSRQLSEREILDVARRLTTSIGISALTMRRLAEELGVSPMATYHHVRSRDALLLLLADDVMRGVLPPPADAGTWDERLWSYMHAMGEELAAHPGLSNFLLDHDTTAEARRYTQRCIEVVREGGFDAAQAKQAFMAIYTYMWGRSIFQAIRNRRSAGGRPARRRRDLPSIDELASDAQVEAGYRALVRGLEDNLKDR
jgi:AcrR family transcriptional regulator